MAEISAAHGGFGAWLAAWPADDIVGLWKELQTRFSQLGGASEPYFLRMAGKDTFILTRGAQQMGWGEGRAQGKEGAP